MFQIMFEILLFALFALNDVTKSFGRSDGRTDKWQDLLELLFATKSDKSRVPPILTISILTRLYYIFLSRRLLTSLGRREGGNWKIFDKILVICQTMKSPQICLTSIFG